MTDSQAKLRNLLKELFQLDNADLDFGIYRIMNAKRAEIERFLDNDLLPQVKKAFEQYQSSDTTALKNELAKLVQQLTDAGVDPDSSPKVKDLRAKLAGAVDVSALESQVFSDLYSFFRRYYSEGDFLSLRRYKEGVYAIPYEGEEVKLYWANHDQYYIKSSEYLRDYRFKVTGGRVVHFKVVEADAEKDNNKAANGNERRFIIAAEQPMAEENGELIIRFEFKPDAQKRKQEALNEAAAQSILAANGFDAWHAALAATAPSPSNPNRTVLARHLADYTARNTFDYFIHKDLGGFLRRELDFYIKNEVMHLDDIESAGLPKVEEVYSRIRILRQIAHKIITFLAQIEDFQKKLWLKKKFVVDCHYLVTLDRVPKSLYDTIAANKPQWDNWESLGFRPTEDDTLLVSGPTWESRKYLDAHPGLVVDTSLFPDAFTDKLLSSTEILGGKPSLDDATSGILIQSDNFQALSFLERRYAGQISGVYIDPPYNTDASPIIYKNGYPHSTWVSLMVDRIGLERQLDADGSLRCVAIDDAEYCNLQLALLGFGDEVHHATAVVRSKPQGRPTTTGFSANHEYATFWGSPKASVGRLPRTGSRAERYPYSDSKGIYSWSNFRKSGTDSDRDDRRRSFYPVYVDGDSVRVPRLEWNDATESWDVLDKPSKAETAVFPIDEDGREKVWTCSAERAVEEIDDIRVVRDGTNRVELQKKYRPNQEGGLPGTWWDNSLYSASESGTKVLKDLFGVSPFDYPKSINLVVDCIRVLNIGSDGIVLDYFGGSATTAHAVLTLNREDKGARRFVLVEMGEHFRTVVKPRVAKVAYSPDWTGGCASVHDKSESCLVKVLRLESYEDSLNNIRLVRTDRQQALLDANTETREEYLLGYMLDMETAGSPALLDVAQLASSTAYSLAIATGTVGESKPTNVNLVETFNWLLGLRVKTMDTIRGVRVVTGTNPQGEKVLILWRNVEAMPSDKLDEFFQKQGYNTKDMEFDVIYVNGDNNLENLKKDEDTWKVRLIEEDFKRLMFDVQDV